MGRFTDGGNILKTADPDLYFRRDARESGFYETAVLIRHGLDDIVLVAGIVELPGSQFRASTAVPASLRLLHCALAGIQSGSGQPRDAL